MREFMMRLPMWKNSECANVAILIVRLAKRGQAEMAGHVELECRIDQPTWLLTVVSRVRDGLVASQRGLLARRER
jgi:hypothetical protein